MHNEAWTGDEDALAVRLRTDARMSAKAIAAELGRTPAATSARLLKLGARIHGREPWDEAGEARLRELVADPGVTVRGVARALGRTECSVRWKIDDLGLVPGRLRPWTRREDARLAAAAGRPATELRALAAELDRSYEAMRARMVRIGHRAKVRWTPEAVERLRTLAGDGAAEAAAALGLPVGAVRAKAYAIGVRLARSPGAGQPWSEVEDAELRRHDGTAAGLTAALSRTGRTERSVRDRMRLLGITAVARPVRPPRPVRPATAVARPVRPAPPARAVPAPVAAPAAARAAVARYLPRPPAPRPGNAGAAALRVGMDAAIARFVAERGVTRAPDGDGAELVRRVRSRGYAVVGNPVDGFSVDGRGVPGGLEGLAAFAEARGIAAPARGALVPAT